VTKLVAQS